MRAWCIELPFNPENADVIYDEINEKLSQMNPSGPEENHVV